MKSRYWRVSAGILMLAILAVMATGCGGRSVEVSTIAGRPGVSDSVDGTGAAARFIWPYRIAVDTAGNLYVTDMGTIRKVTPAATVTTLAGRPDDPKGSVDGSGAQARFGMLSGIAVDTAGNLFVIDGFSVRQVTPAGVVTTLAGNADVKGSIDGQGAEARFGGLGGITIDATGNLFVTDVANRAVRKITPTGEVTTLTVRTGAPPSFESLSGITVDTAGNLYVVDNGAKTIVKITPAGDVTALAGGGKVSLPPGADGKGATARFVSPDGISIDAAGNLYVTDDATVRQITPDGKVTTLAGVASYKGSADGSGAASRFNQPAGIACDAAGDLYVVDSANCTIRKLTLGD